MVSSTQTFTSMATANLSEECSFALLDQCDLTIRLSQVMFPITLVNIIAGVIANVIVITVILAFGEMRTIPSIYVANLAVTDVFFLVFVGGSNCYEFYVGAFQPPNWQDLSAFLYYMELVAAMATALMMTSLTVDRFLAIVYPLRSQGSRTKKRAIVVCIAVWIFSFSIGSIYFAAPISGDIIEAWREPLAPYFVTIGCICNFLIPLIIIFACYAAILKTIWRQRMTDAHASEETRQRRTREKYAVLRASFFIVGMFIVCNGFYIVTFEWIVFGGTRGVDPYTVIIVYNTAQGLLHMNSLVNPFLYALSHARFYHYIRQLVCYPCIARRSKKSVPGVYNIAYQGSQDKIATKV